MQRVACTLRIWGRPPLAETHSSLAGLLLECQVIVQVRGVDFWMGSSVVYSRAECAECCLHSNSPTRRGRCNVSAEGWRLWVMRNLMKCARSGSVDFSHSFLWLILPILCTTLHCRFVAVLENGIAYGWGQSSLAPLCWAEPMGYLNSSA